MIWLSNHNTLLRRTRSDLGYLSVTVCIHRGRSAFLDASLVDEGVAALRRAASDERCLVPVYCFMPDHLHALIEGTSKDSDQRKMIVRFKQYSRHALQRDMRGYRWQKAVYAHGLRANESWTAHARYILGSPVRRNLVLHPRDYPFSGAIGYEFESMLEQVMPVAVH